MTDAHTDQPVDETVDLPSEPTNDPIEELKQKWLRALADYQNLQRDTARDRAEWAQYATAGLLSDLLPVIDNLKMALRHVPAEQATAEWVVGLEHIQRQFTDVLRGAGVAEIKTVGQPFDPARHEAVGTRAVEDTPADVVVEEVQGGYTLHDRVLRAAKVIVSH